jgi:hypothetical protein
MIVHGMRVVYNKVRLVERDPNHDGFLDIDHAVAKPPGVVRIGFFGDSYVEAMMVPQESAFFRILPAMLRGEVETFGFGISGWGTLQTERAFDVFGPRYGLDAAVYVFAENDPGDNCFDMAAQPALVSSGMPYAALHADGQGYELRWIVRPGDEPWWYGPAKVVQRHSLLAQVVRARLDLLHRRGVQVAARPGDAQMSGVSGAVPDVSDLPSTWPAPYVERAGRLGELLLREWRDAAARRDARFFVLYVPRGEDQLTGKLPVASTWLPWLRASCASLGVTLIDPSAALLARLQHGDAVYDDHWTPAGHQVVAQVLAAALGSALPAVLPPGRPEKPPLTR